MGNIFKSHHGWFSQVNSLKFNELFIKNFRFNHVKSILNKPWKFILFLSLFLTAIATLSLPLGGFLLSLYVSFMASWIGAQFYEKNAHKTSNHDVELIVVSSDVVKSQPQTLRVKEVVTLLPHSFVTLARFMPYFNHALSMIRDNTDMQLQHSRALVLHDASRITHGAVAVACNEVFYNTNMAKSSNQMMASMPTYCGLSLRETLHQREITFVIRWQGTVLSMSMIQFKHTNAYQIYVQRHVLRHATNGEYALLAASETRSLQEESTLLPSPQHVSRQLLQDVRKHNLRRTLNTLQWSLHQHGMGHALQHPFAMQMFKFIHSMHGTWFSVSTSFEHTTLPQRMVLAIAPPSANHEQHLLNHDSCARPLRFNTDATPVMANVSLPARLTSYLEPLLHHLFAQYQRASSSHMNEAITRDEACSLLALCDEALDQPIVTGLQNVVHEEATQPVFEEMEEVIDEQTIDERFKATAIRHEDLNKTMSQHLLKAIGVKRLVVSSTEPVNTKVPVVSAPKKTAVLSYASIVAKMRADLAAKNKSQSALKTVNTIQKNPHPLAKHATQQALAPKTFSQHLLHAAKQLKSTDMPSSGMLHVTKQSQRPAGQSQRPAIDSRDPVLLSHAQTPAASSVLVSENTISLTTRPELTNTHITSQINTAYLPQFSFLTIDPNMMVADDKTEESNDELQNRLRDTVERYCAFLKGGVM